jgi:L-aspartate semialdehyde sulfurtransferase
MAKTVAEINERIARREAVVVTADEMKDIVSARGASAAARDVDVVTTGTFAPMCSSALLFNAGHPTPRMKIRRAWLNGVPAHAGLAAADLMMGATELHEADPDNRVYPGAFRYGGGHVIEDLLSGKEVELRAEAYGTDCYPRKELRTLISLGDFNTACLVNPRNCYQNYNVAVNAHASRTLYTYLGVLRPGLANANYCSAGQLSPLLNDPHYRTIGIGTRLFIGGGSGFVTGPGTQHYPCGARSVRGVPTEGAGTISLTGDLKGMSREFVRGVSVTGYGVSLALGIGIPIPILDEEMAAFTGVRDEDILAPVIDYSKDYPENRPEPLCHVSYGQLRSGWIEVAGRRVRTAPLSSLAGARKVAAALRGMILSGRLSPTEPVERLPGAESGIRLRPLRIRHGRTAG